MKLNPYPGLEYLFLCVVNDNKTDVPTAGELIKNAVDAYVQYWRTLVKGEAVAFQAKP